MTTNFKLPFDGGFHVSAQRQSFSGSVIALAAALALSGCGGGGGGKGAVPSSAPAPNSAPPVVAPNPTVAFVASVPVPSYATTSEEWSAFQALNDARSFCGFGLLAQNTKLDGAARGHADWLIRNGYGGHFQVANTPGFTGVSPGDRVAAAGYGDLGTFVSTSLLFGLQGTLVSELGQGKASVTGLLNAPYHGAGMLSGALEVGVAVRDVADVGVSPVGPRVQVDFDMAYRTATGPQAPAADAVLTYPCEGRTGVDRLLDNEPPNPVPGRDLAIQPLGTSVIVRLRLGQVLRITQATMVEATTGTSVPLRAPVSTAFGNDPYGLLLSHEAYVAAENPLRPRTTYQVSLQGSNNGTAFSRSFKFTTGD